MEKAGDALHTGLEFCPGKVALQCRILIRKILIRKIFLETAQPQFASPCQPLKTNQIFKPRTTSLPGLFWPSAHLVLLPSSSHGLLCILKVWTSPTLGILSHWCLSYSTYCQLPQCPSCSLFVSPIILLDDSRAHSPKKIQLHDSLLLRHFPLYFNLLNKHRCQ